MEFRQTHRAGSLRGHPSDNPLVFWSQKVALALSLALAACGPVEDNTLENSTFHPVRSGHWVVSLRESPGSHDVPALSRHLGQRLSAALAPRFQETAPALGFDLNAAALALRPEILTIPQSPSFIAIFNTNSIWNQMRSRNTFSSITPRTQAPLELAALLSLDHVEWVEPDGETPLEFPAVSEPAPLPTTPQFEPWLRLNLDKALAHIASTNVTPRPVTVAVLDTGVDALHPDLKEQMFENTLEKNGKDGVDDDKNGHTDDIHGADMTLEPGKSDSGPSPAPGSGDLGGPGHPCPNAPGNDSRACGHGTHVAGIISAKPRSDALTQGLCPSCRILSLRVTRRVFANGYEYDGPISDSAQIRALAYILNLWDPKDPTRLATHVVNMSLGKYFRSQTMAYLLRELRKRDVIVVAAAGNDDTDTPTYPAAYESVVSVCALGNDENGSRTAFHRGKFGKAVFSNFGDWVSICAPGTEIVSTVPSNGENTPRDTRSGTSQATPFVAGALGFLISLTPPENRAAGRQSLDHLLRGADAASVYSSPFNRLYKRDLPDGQSVRLLGAGAVDLYNSTLLTLGDPEGKRTGTPRAAAKARVEGCVLNVAGSAQGGASTSLPAVAFSLWMLWRVARRLTIHTQKKERTRTCIQ